MFEMNTCEQKGWHDWNLENHERENKMESLSMQEEGQRAQVEQ